jgi:lipoyl-dependent peroxiredoxin
MAVKTATTLWKGNLFEGHGEVSTESGVITGRKATWDVRTGDHGGETSPEELIAAAHSSCYAMALAHTLTSNGFEVETLDVTCQVTFGPKPEGGMQVTSSALSVVGKVAGLDDAGFKEWAAKGEAGCPVSGALRGNVEITVEARLA